MLTHPPTQDVMMTIWHSQLHLPMLLQHCVDISLGNIFTWMLIEHLSHLTQQWLLHLKVLYQTKAFVLVHINEFQGQHFLELGRSELIKLFVANPIHLHKDVCSITWRMRETLNLLILVSMTMTITILEHRPMPSVSEEIRKCVRLPTKPVRMMENPSTPLRNHQLQL